ncbi:MAG TPA: hypothetical protein VGM91_04730 [Conexibacter sp.]|jgi:hypothetical protein
MSTTGRRRALLVAACALSAAAITVFALGGWEGKGRAKTITTPAARVADVPVAPAGPKPSLPAGWRRVRDGDGGFTVGLPPGWSAHRSRGTLVLRSKDKTIAIAVGADRSAPGRVARPQTYAREAMASLPGYRHLRASSTRRLDHAPYPAARATATGTFAQTGIAQAITLVALQRRGEATFTLLAFSSSTTPRSPARRVVDRVVGTLHSDRPA